MTGDEFFEAAARLRSLGACKVRVGDMEVVFQPTTTSRQQLAEAAPAAHRPVKKAMTPEDQLIASFREEMGELV